MSDDIKRRDLFTLRHAVHLGKLILDLVAVVFLWRSVWWFADHLFGTEAAGYIISGLVALLILFLDDFTFKEFEV